MLHLLLACCPCTKATFAWNLHLVLYSAPLYCNFSPWDLYLNQSIQQVPASSRNPRTDNLKGVSVFIFS
jgi:hypothetical protein